MSKAPHPISPARRAAWDVLAAWLATGPSKARLGSRKRPFPPESLSVRDQAFARRLAESTVQQYGSLDAILLKLAKGRKPRPHGLHAALLLAGWELLHCPDTPAHAIVHEGVSLARLAAKEGGARFANALLRRLCEQREPGAWLPRPTEESPVDELATWYSQTPYLVERWLAEHGPARTLELLHGCNQEPRLTLRVNARRLTRPELSEKLKHDGIETGPGFHPLSLLVDGHPPGLLETSAWKAGDFSVQGSTQTEIVDMVQAAKGERILDLCAAPGGKATGLCEATDDGAFVYAYDDNQSRLAPMQAELARLGLRSVRILDSRESLEAEAAAEPFDRILVDAPCTNTGVLDKRSEARWHLGQKALDRLVQTQRELLEQAAGYLRPGGMLVYSTCSIEPEENELLAQSLDGQQGLRLLSTERILPVQGLRDGGGATCFLKS